MTYSAAVITVSDRGSRGERRDTSGPALKRMLEENGWQVDYTAIVPDEGAAIRGELIECADQRGVCLTVTTGGTGLSPRDVTPEATLAVIERETPGIPEAMRAASMRITPLGCLSRAVAGVRGGTLIVNLPGSEKAACECLSEVITPILHGVETLRGEASECAAKPMRVLAVCVSDKKGVQKHETDAVRLFPELGVEGDAHAGPGNRQVSLLARESVDKVQQKVDFEILPGAFAENILTEGVTLFELPIGSRLKLGRALCEVTQIGKECHHSCAIREAAGDCVMPREGIFVKVLSEGEVKPGDTITLM